MSANSSRKSLHSLVRSVVKRIEDLPVLPGVAVQALTLSMSDNTALDKLAGIMEVDPVLTARMLRLVNNTQSGLPTNVTTVKQAVALAGLNQVRCALLGVMIQDYLPSGSKKTIAADKQLWAHSLMTAVMAQLLAQKSFPELQDTAFVGGLLHDIGKIVIQDVFPDSVAEIITLQEEERYNSLEAEQNVVDINHCIVGKMLAEQWNLPEPLLDCIWLHHLRPEIPDITSAHRELIWIVALANLLAAEMLMAPQKNELIGVQKSLLTALKLRASDLEPIRLKATKEYEKKAGFFNLESNIHVILHDILQKANRKLSRLGAELDTQRTALLKSNNLLELTRKLCLGLERVRSKGDLLLQVTQSFQGFTPVPLGIFYIIEQETRELEGVVWTESGQRRRLLCFTDRNGEPVWEHDDQTLPSNLRKILSYYKLRAQKTEALCVTTSPPFHVFSFGLEGEYFAELCISVQQEYRDKDNTQFQAFLHVAQLLWSAVQGVRLLERLQRSQDDLSQALWKNKQINEHIFQTERLAAVGQLAAGAAHEINNPLAIISARAQLLELKEQDEKKKKELGVIAQQIDRISKIISNLLDFARPVPPKLRDVDIHDVLDRVLELTSNDLAKYGIDLKKRYDSSMVLIKADPNQLEQVFLNLVINAQHAMEKNGGVLTISTALTGAGTKAVIKVADQGVGISRENMKRIFDPFFTTKAEGKGTGLGLSTSLGIIYSHFGKIDVDSALGQGTVFTIELPVDIVALRPDQEEGETLPASLLSSRIKILVVDDEEHIREILKETLESENIVAATAGNGQKALEMLAVEAFDLMLLDIRMPFCDGLSVLREVRKADPSLPVIVITGMASREEMEEAKSYGNCKCIRKPFHIKTLLAEIRESLANVQ